MNFVLFIGSMTCNRVVKFNQANSNVNGVKATPQFEKLFWNNKLQLHTATQSYTQLHTATHSYTQLHKSLQTNDLFQEHNTKVLL